MSRLVVVAPGLVIVLAVACRKEEPQPRPHVGVATPAPAHSPTPHPEADPCTKAEVEGPIAWIHDDYPAALACAKQRKEPLVVDLWAPWCHTCLSMQTTVFQEASFAPDAKRFVFVALDTDRDANAPAIAKLALSAWPTFYVVGTDEAVLARFVGGASSAQFHAFLDAGAKAAGTAPEGPDLHLLSAERALAAKDLATAETELTAALASAPASWVRRPDAMVSLILTKAKRKDVEGCLALADRELDAMGNSAAASDFLGTAMGCADELPGQAQPKPDPKHPPAPAQLKGADRVAKLRARAVTRWRALLADPSSPMSVDDRSDAMAQLRETLDKLGDHPAAVAVAEQQRAALDAAATAATTPLGAMTYHWPRAEVYAYLGKPLELVPALEASAAALPKEYEPRARLGWVLMKAGKLADAAKWTDQALALVYGPRKARLLGQRADIAHGLGDTAGERGYREQVVALLAALPDGQKSDEALAHAKDALAALDKPAGPKPKN